MKKIIVGLTGGFGSGKSTVAEMFRELGAHIISADQLAREALEPGQAPYEKLVKLWGPAILKSDKTVNRARVAEIIFRDPKKRKEIEIIIHPYVFDRMGKEIQKTSQAVAVLEVPLLFETRFHERCDRTITVTAPHELIEKRLMQKGFSREEIHLRLQSQMELAEKMRLSNFVIRNEAGLESLREQAKQIWQTLVK